MFRQPQAPRNNQWSFPWWQALCSITGFSPSSHMTPCTFCRRHCWSSGLLCHEFSLRSSFDHRIQHNFFFQTLSMWLKFKPLINKFPNSPGLRIIPSVLWSLTFLLWLVWLSYEDTGFFALQWRKEFFKLNLFLLSHIHSTYLSTRRRFAECALSCTSRSLLLAPSHSASKATHLLRFFPFGLTTFSPLSLPPSFPHLAPSSQYSSSSNQNLSVCEDDLASTQACPLLAPLLPVDHCLHCSLDTHSYCCILDLVTTGKCTTSGMLTSKMSFSSATSSSSRSLCSVMPTPLLPSTFYPSALSWPPFSPYQPTFQDPSL